MQQIGYLQNNIPTNQQNFDNPQTLAPTNKNDSTGSLTSILVKSQWECISLKISQCIERFSQSTGKWSNDANKQYLTTSVSILSLSVGPQT